MSTPRDHHFVPVFYLKRWALNGRLFEYSIKHGNFLAKTVGPRATGYERDLYAFADLPDELAHYLESVFLQRNDHAASKALRILLAEDKTAWTSELRSSWSRFLIGFLIRHPDPFAELKQAARERWLAPDPETQAEYEKIRQPTDPPTFEEYVEGVGGGLAEKIRVRLLQGVMDNEPLGRRINAMRWGTLNLGASPDSLLTSDWPLDKNLPPANGYIALPITPKHLFVGVYEQWVLDDLRKQPPKRIVHTVNKLVVTRARRYVWSCDDRQRAFIEKHMSANALNHPFFPSISKPDVRV